MSESDTARRLRTVDLLSSHGSQWSSSFATEAARNTRLFTVPPRRLVCHWQRARLRPLQVKRFTYLNEKVPRFPRYPAQARENTYLPEFDKQKRPCIAWAFLFVGSRRLPTLPGRQRNSRGASGLKPTPTAPLLAFPPRRLLCHWQRVAPSCCKSSALRALSG